MAPRIGVTLISRKELNVDAVIDTGFTGELFVPEEIAIELGLRIAGVQSVMLADGSTPDLQTAKVAVGWESEEKTVLALIGNGDDVLIGVQLLKDSEITISFPEKKVSVLAKG